VFTDVLGDAQHRHIIVYRPIYIYIYMHFAQRPFMEETLQDTLKVKCSLLSWRKAVERLCIMSCKIAVHVILSYPPGQALLFHFHTRTYSSTTDVHSLVIEVYHAYDT